MVLADRLLVWRTIDEYCLLNWLAINVGFEIYFPLNLILVFSLVFVLPFRYLINLKNLEESFLMLCSETAVLHFSLLWAFISFSMRWFSSASCGASGCVARRSSLSLIKSAADVGTSGRMVLILPDGMFVLCALLIILLKVFSAE